MLRPDLPVPRNDLERMCEVLYTMVWQHDMKKERQLADDRRAAYEEASP